MGNVGRKILELVQYAPPPLKEGLKRTRVVNLSVGPVTLEFYQELGTTKEWVTEFETEVDISQLTVEDWQLIKLVGKEMAYEARHNWS